MGISKRPRVSVVIGNTNKQFDAGTLLLFTSIRNAVTCGMHDEPVLYPYVTQALQYHDVCYVIPRYEFSDSLCRKIEACVERYSIVDVTVVHNVHYKDASDFVDTLSCWLDDKQAKARLVSMVKSPKW